MYSINRECFYEEIAVKYAHINVPIGGKYSQKERSMEKYAQSMYDVIVIQNKGILIANAIRTIGVHEICKTRYVMKNYNA